MSYGEILWYTKQISTAQVMQSKQIKMLSIEAHFKYVITQQNCVKLIS